MIHAIIRIVGGEVMQKRKIKLKRPAIILLWVLGGIFACLIVLGIFYSYQIHSLTSLGYSKKASHQILLQFKKDYIVSVGENKTLNAAFESEDYVEKNLDHYQKIKYQKQENLIANINKLIKKGYSDYEISMIVTHGDDQAVSDFAKRDKVRYLEEFYSISYARLENYDRYLKYMDEEREDEETTVLHVNLNLDIPDYEQAVEVAQFSIDMFVNKHHYLDKNFKVDDLVVVDSKYTVGDQKIKANREAYNAFVSMLKDGEKEDMHFLINSCYRSYQDQEETWNTYKGLYGDNYVLKYVAKPGFSEHQTGLGFDIASTSANVFVESKESKWLFDNAYKYGFIYRYPKGLESITGYNYESWHYRYVGKKIAKYIEDNNITFDEYYVRFLDKD